MLNPAIVSQIEKHREDLGKLISALTSYEEEINVAQENIPEAYERDENKKDAMRQSFASLKKERGAVLNVMFSVFKEEITDVMFRVINSKRDE